MKTEDMIYEGVNTHENFYKKYQDELDFVKSKDFKIGEYLYMGMAYVAGHLHVISVAYKIDYCVKKAVEFMSHCGDVYFDRIHKVKVGELKACDKFSVLIPTYIRTINLPSDEVIPAVFDITRNKFITKDNHNVISEYNISEIVSPDRVLGKNARGAFKIKKLK